MAEHNRRGPVSTSREIWCVESDPTSAGHGFQQIFPSWAVCIVGCVGYILTEGLVEIRGFDVALCISLEWAEVALSTSMLQFRRRPQATGHQTLTCSDHDIDLEHCPTASSPASGHGSATISR